MTMLGTHKLSLLAAIVAAPEGLTSVELDNMFPGGRKAHKCLPEMERAELVELKRVPGVVPSLSKLAKTKINGRDCFIWVATQKGKELAFKQSLNVTTTAVAAQARQDVAGLMSAA